MTTWQDIPGWSCKRIIELYDEMALVLKPGMVAVECGVAYGKSLAYLASVLYPEVDILAVDVWHTFQGRTSLDRAHWEAIRRTQLSPLEAARSNVREALTDVPNQRHRWTRIEWVQARSEDVPKYFDFDVDFVFLDDHHEEESVYAEIMAWLPRLKPGGVIAGHDVNAHYPGVERAVRSAIPKFCGMHGLRTKAVGDGSQDGIGIEIRPPHPDENGWGGCWIWRKP